MKTKVMPFNNRKGLRGRVEVGSMGIDIFIDGYGTGDMQPFMGTVVFVEHHDGKLKCHCWDNINDPDPKTIVLEGSNEKFRKDEHVEQK